MKPDAVTLEYSLRRTIERLFTSFVANPMEPGLLQRLLETIDLVLSLPFEVRLWEAQNTYYSMMRDYAGTVRECAEGGDAEARRNCLRSRVERAIWIGHQRPDVDLH